MALTFKNLIQKITPAWIAPDYQLNIPTEQKKRQTAKDVDSYISRVQFARIKQDVQTWRDAVTEAELPLWPHRVKMQRIFQDTILNGHVTACMNKRKNLTLLRDFSFYDGDEAKDELAAIIKKEWFMQMVSYILDAPAFGYTLLGFGDIINNELPQLELIRRQNISPDRMNVVSLVYSLSGINFFEGGSNDLEGNSFYDWTAWIPTPTELGVSKCGYGYLYKIALYEIFLRNTLGFNADFIELYAQPYRVGKTTKSDGPERDKMEAALRDMGSSGYAIIDPTDEIAFLETKLGGTGWKGYQDFEMRLEKKITKIILGHEDAMSSTPGKLGSTQGEESPQQISMDEIQTIDGRFVETVLNGEVFPKLRALGMQIPDLPFRFKNDAEKQQIREREDETNQKTVNIVSTLKTAGYEVDAEYISERTGIPVTKVEQPKPTNSFLSPNNKTKLRKLYGKDH